MNDNINRSAIGHYYFSQIKHQRFTAESGDTNPIHTDEKEASKCLTGKIIIHGMHTLLAAIDSWSARHKLNISHIKCNLIAPISLNEIAEFHENQLSDKIWKIRVFSQNVEKATITLSTSASQYHSHPLDQSTLFPFASQNTSQNIVKAIMQCSHHVGMECPGLYSIFSSIDVTLNTDNKECESIFKLDSHDARFGLYTIDVSGPLNGHIKALQRPMPFIPPSLQDARALVEENVFHGIQALIIGGSRGIGACVTKLLAAGGAKVTLTWKINRENSFAIRQEIQDQFPGRCQDTFLDIYESDLNLYKEIFENSNAIFYFATPQINKNPDANQREIYKEIYIKKFEELCQTLCKYSISPISVFLPSTEYIDKPNKLFAPYIEAKLEAEKISDKINHSQTMIRIYPYRLPRMNTDQTATSGITQPQDTMTAILPFLHDFCQKI